MKRGRETEVRLRHFFWCANAHTADLQSLKSVDYATAASRFGSNRKSGSLSRTVVYVVSCKRECTRHISDISILSCNRTSYSGSLDRREYTDSLFRIARVLRGRVCNQSHVKKQLLQRARLLDENSSSPHLGVKSRCHTRGAEVAVARTSISLCTLRMKSEDMREVSTRSVV